MPGSFPGDLSPFPAGYAGLEFFIGGAWTAVPLSELGDDGIAISRGRGDESAQVDASTMRARLKNPTGKWSPRNPAGDNYGLIGRNTPVRAFVDLGAPWLNLSGTNANVTTPDSAALSITGDLEIQYEAFRQTWATNAVDLVSKWGAVGQQSWVLRAQADGTLILFWSPDGTAVLSAASLVPLPAGVRRVAVKATLQVNNGAGGRTITFWRAATIADPWTQLGGTVVQAGTTGIFDSTAPVTLGKLAISTASSADQRLYACRILQGIGGTLRAAVDAAALTVGASTFSDGLATWTVNAPAAVSKRHYRYWAQVSEWQQRWGVKGSPSAYAAIECAGVLRRIGQGSSPLRSALYRTLSKIGSNLVGYWPLEDLDTASTYAGGTATTRPMIVYGTPTNAGYTGFPSSAPIVSLESGRVTGVLAGYTATGFGQVRWLTRIPASTPNGAVLARVRATGTLGWAEVRYTTGGGLIIEGFNESGVSVGSNTYALAVDGRRLRCSLELTQSGGNITWTFAIYEPGAANGSFGTGTFTGVTLGSVFSVDFNPNRAAMAGVALGHITVEKTITTLYDVSVAVLLGYAGEQAGTRVARLAAENGINATVIGAAWPSVLLGAQGRTDLLALLREAAAADTGPLYEPRTSDDLAIRTLVSQYNQTPAVTFAYTGNLLRPFEPVDDDQATRNLVTATRAGGSSATVEQATGVLSTQAPPAGVGIYDDEVSLSLAGDGQCADQAGWRVHLGVVDEARWPVIGLDLAHPTFLANATLTRDILASDLGDRWVVTGLPGWLPPDPVSQLVQGYTETIGPLSYRIEAACVPARPYRCLTWSEPADRWSNDSATLAAGATSGATSWSVATATGPLWSSADGAFDLIVAGERVTVTAVAGITSPQTFTVVRAVNGVVKAQVAGAAVALYDPVYWALI